MLSPYLAWFSMPVPTQHQNESLGVLKTLAHAGLQRQVVADHARLRVLRGEDVVVEGPLVVVGVLGLAGPSRRAAA